MRRAIYNWLFNSGRSQFGEVPAQPNNFTWLILWIAVTLFVVAFIVGAK